MPKVINLKRDTILASSPQTLYIGRPRDNRPLHYGNPFSHLLQSKAAVHVASASEAVQAFADWLDGVAYTNVEPERRQWILENLQPIRDAKYISCFCAPGPCHGTPLAERAMKLTQTAAPVCTPTPAPAQTSNEISVAVIGTAGRGDDNKELYPEKFAAMREKTIEALNILRSKGYTINRLVSGGAAWADHLAVDLYLHSQVPALTLHLPAPFKNGQFHDTGVFDWKTNPGGTVNHYHRLFSARLEKDTFAEIGQAIAKGATVVITPGLFERNALVAKADAVIALTFGRGKELKDGGTAHTAEAYLRNCGRVSKAPLAFHIDLHAGELHEGMEIPKPTPKLPRQQPVIDRSR
jgi:hypothetical protein